MFPKKAQTGHDDYVAKLERLNDDLVARLDRMIEKADRLVEMVDALALKAERHEEKLAAAKTVVLYRDKCGRFKKKDS